MKKSVLIVPLLMLPFLCSCDENGTSSFNHNVTVSFDSNGGTQVAEQSIKRGRKATKPEDPFKEGYTFANWTYHDNEYDFDTPVYKDITLVANYVQDDYTVVFKNVDGTVLDTQDNLHFGDAIKYHGERPTYPNPNPEYTYLFAGWDQPLIVTGDMVINALFNSRYAKYTLRYVSRDMVVLYEGIIDDPENIPAYPNGRLPDYTENGLQYQFSGWRRVDNNDEITMYAQYEACSYGVNFNMNVVSGYEGDAENVVLPRKWNGYTIDTIGEEAFKDCTFVKEVDVPETVNDVLMNAFQNCTGLESISFKEGLHFLENKAFNGCTSLRSISIPNSFINISSNAFEGCTALTYNEYQNGLYLGNANNPYLVLMSLINKSADSFVMHDNCEVTAGSAFTDTAALRNVVVSNNLRQLGQNGFCYCTNLNAITYDNAKYIGSATNPYLVLIKANNKSIDECNVHTNCKLNDDNAFNGCTKLKGVVLPAGLTYLGMQAFYNCEALTAIDVPASVVSIDPLAFAKCKKLETVVLHDGLIYIEPDAFAQCEALKEITIPDTVIYLGDSAFSTCTALEEVTLSKNLIKICRNTFSNCSSLKSVFIPKDVNEIKERAFYNCTSLETVYMPYSVKVLGARLFTGINRQVVINYAGREADWNDIVKDATWNSGANQLVVEFPDYQAEQE